MLQFLQIIITFYVIFTQNDANECSLRSDFFTGKGTLQEETGKNFTSFLNPLHCSVVLNRSFVSLFTFFFPDSYDRSVKRGFIRAICSCI